MTSSAIDIATLITAIGVAVGTVVTAWRSKQNGTKLDKIHKDTNGSLTTLKRELAATRRLLQAEYKKTKTSGKVYKPKVKLKL